MANTARKLDYRVLNRKDQMKDLIVIMSKKENGNMAIKLSYNRPFSSHYSFDDPNIAWQAWKSDFNAILHHHAPIRHMQARQSSVPWLMFDIKKMLKE